jgi:hypothetical protein
MTKSNERLLIDIGTLPCGGLISVRRRGCLANTQERDSLIASEVASATQLTVTISAIQFQT